MSTACKSLDLSNCFGASPAVYAVSELLGRVPGVELGDKLVIDRAAKAKERGDKFGPSHFWKRVRRMKAVKVNGHWVNPRTGKLMSKNIQLEVRPKR